MKFFFPGLLAVTVSLLLSSCGVSSPIERYSESKSHFWNPPVLMSHSFPPQDVYRVYEQGATGFVPVSALRSSAEERATEFCRRQGRSMQVLGEKRTIAFPLPGNFPALELVFASVPRLGGRTTDADVARLTKLKKLRDEGVISDEEFEQEKEAFLNAGQ